MSIRPRDLPGRDILESLQKFEWRYQTLRTDFNELIELRDPEPSETVSQHRFSDRSRLHEAERRLHHFLSGYYTFKSLTTTLATSAPEPEFEGRVKHRRDQFGILGSSRVILGLRHYVQHHNIIPLLVKMTSLSADGPRYVINKDELRLDDFEYREPQMVLDVGEYDPWFDYYFEDVEGICIYPFQTISDNWSEVNSLRDDVYDLARTHLSEEIDEYIAQLRELMVVREQLREEQPHLDEMIDELNISPGIGELLPAEIYDRLIEE